MANAPTHPPNRSNHGGSPPKGPRRMTRSRRLAPDTVRERLTVLSDRLKGTPSPGADPGLTDADYAEAVDAVLAPWGWELLKKESVVSETARINLAMFMPAAVKKALEAKARVEAVEDAKEMGATPKPAGTVLGEVIDQGFDQFLRGLFTPERPLKKPRGRGPEIVKSNLNVRADKALRDRVAAVCPDRSAQLGWTVTPGLVAMAWLFSEYGITEDDQIGVTTPEMPAAAE